MLVLVAGACRTPTLVLPELADLSVAMRDDLSRTKKLDFTLVGTPRLVELLRADVVATLHAAGRESITQTESGDDKIHLIRFDATPSQAREPNAPAWACVDVYLLQVTSRTGLRCSATCNVGLFAAGVHAEWGTTILLEPTQGADGRTLTLARQTICKLLHAVHGPQAMRSLASTPGRSDELAAIALDMSAHASEPAPRRDRR